MGRSAALAAGLALLAGCGGGGEAPRSLDPEAAVLALSDLPRGYRHGDDTGCSRQTTAYEGDWPLLRPLFAKELPSACIAQFERVWGGLSRRRPVVNSAAFMFRDADGAHRAFEAREELARFVAGLEVEAGDPADLGDEGELLRGNRAAALVWRDENVLAVLAVEPADADAARALALKQQERIEHPSPPSAADDTEVELDNPSLELPVYWLGRAFDPSGDLPRLLLADAAVLEGGPGSA